MPLARGNLLGYSILSNMLAIAVNVAVARADDAVHYKWIIANNVNHSYSTTVDINGKRWSVYEDGSSVSAKPLPFKEGENKIKIVFTPQTNAKAKHHSSKAKMKLMISPSMQPDDSMLTLADSETDDGFEETEISVTFAKGQPGKLQSETKNWVDAEHKKLSIETTSDGDAGADHWAHRTTRIWNPDGKPISDSTEKDGKLVIEKDFKPDGSLGAEVKDGSGATRTFFEDGAPASETLYKKGVMDGEAREFHDNGKVAKSTHYAAGQAEGDYHEYDPQGKVQVSGQFSADMKSGVWIRYDAKGKEATRSEFKEDKLIKGSDTFE